MSATTGVVQFRGGSHDGERIAPQPGQALADRLFAIDFDDGARYARIGEEFEDFSGDRVAVSELDGDGSLTRRAKVVFGRLSEDAPCFEPPE